VVVELEVWYGIQSGELVSSSSTGGVSYGVDNCRSGGGYDSLGATGMGGSYGAVGGPQWYGMTSPGGDIGCTGNWS
jgi:hypothetical protein